MTYTLSSKEDRKESSTQRQRDGALRSLEGRRTPCAARASRSEEFRHRPGHRNRPPHPTPGPPWGQRRPPHGRTDEPEEDDRRNALARRGARSDRGVEKHRRRPSDRRSRQPAPMWSAPKTGDRTENRPRP